MRIPLLVAVVTGAVGLGGCTTGGREASLKAEVPVDGASISFLDARGQVVTAVLRENQSESDEGSIVVLRGNTKAQVLGLGEAVRGFGTPWTVSVPEKGWALVAIPYHFAGGTGVGEFHWALLLVTPEAAYLEFMGLWELWNDDTRTRYSFALSPKLIRQSESGMPVFEFTAEEAEAGESKYVCGEVELDVRLAGGVLTAKLCARYSRDMQACARMQRAKMKSARDWARDVDIPRTTTQPASAPVD